MTAIDSWFDEARELRLAGRITRIVGHGPTFDVELDHSGYWQRVALHPRRGFIVPRRWRKPRFRARW